MLPQQYCLRWRYHHSNLQTMFSQLLDRQAYCDVVLACEGKTIKCHKIVLSACSTYFDTILSEYQEKDPIVIMKDMKYTDMKSLVDFMYKGEINVEHSQLATLLKTAEELHIKGLAEVTWRGDEFGSSDANTNGVQSVIPHVSTVMNSPKSSETKRKRGRPPIDDDSQGLPQNAPKVAKITGSTEDAYSNDALSNSDHDLSIWEEDNAGNDYDGEEDNLLRVKTELTTDDEGMDDAVDPIGMTDVKVEPSIKILNSSMNTTIKASTSTNSSYNTSSNTSALSAALTAQLEKEWPDVIKMNDYLNTGRRQQFWEEPFTKRVMDAIKNKNLEMKIAAELLGVSYGTLYGRYRDAYGCLKHPYRIPSAPPGGRMQNFWSEQGPTDVLIKLKKKEITLFRAAEQLNVTPQTLSNYLISMSVLDNEANQSSVHSNPTSDAYEEAESDEDADAILPDVPVNSSLFKSATSNSHSSSSNSVLANCPDITIIKKEKSDSSKVNNNSDHSERQSD